MCFTGAYPRDGSVEATRPTPALSFPCLEPAVPSWARWPLAMLPSKFRREYLVGGWHRDRELSELWVGWMEDWLVGGGLQESPRLPDPSGAVHLLFRY